MPYSTLDTDRREPLISGRRISVLDVYTTVNSSEHWEHVVYEDWGLSEKQVTEALDYYEENRDELEALRREKQSFREDDTA